jgi:Right handed beta helix region
LANAVLTGNTAARGGGIYDPSTNAASVITVVNSSISNDSGGGIAVGASGATLTVTNSTLANNQAMIDGGGIGFFAPGGSLTITGSTLSGSTAGAGGGLYFGGSGTSALTIKNCTIVNNTAVGYSYYGSGGGIVIGYGTAGAAVNIISSTIVGNLATSTVAGNYYGQVFGGGGIYVDVGTGALIALGNSVVSGNQSPSGNTDIAAYPGAVVATAYTAIGSAAGFTYTPGPGDLPIGANLSLQPLANNGGPTQTIAFGVGSPLLSAGDPSLANTTDQRGVPRNIGPAPDIGAYEYQPITVAGIALSDGIASDGTAQRSEVRQIAVTFSGLVSFANGNAAAAFQLQHVEDSTNINNLAAAVSANSSGDTVVTLTFTTMNNAPTEIDPVSAENGGMASLADGQFSLTVIASAVTDAALGWALDGAADGVPGGNYISPTDTQGGGPGQLQLYRLFGDATGDGIVDQSDLGLFRAAYNSSVGNPAYVAYLDADNSGTIDQIDLGQFRQRDNGSVFAPNVPHADSPGPGSGSGSAPGPVWAPGPTVTLEPIVAPVSAVAPVPAAVVSGAINSESAQRSEVPTVADIFTAPIDFDEGTANAGMASLASGSYRATIRDGDNGLGLDWDTGGNYLSPTDTIGGGPGEPGLYRLFGDGDGDGIVDQTDLGQFRTTFNASTGDPNYLAYLDAANSGTVEQVALGQFRSRVNTSVF